MIGQTISHYRILEKLGEGGMGVVYRAEDLKLGRTVALKFLPPDSIAREEDRARLVHEARAAAALLHPNICPIYEIAEADGRTFIAMAHIEGRSLKDRIADGPLPLDEALAIARQIGDALAAAHAKGIIHRDIKPANIMLTPEGRPMLMDFGLAKVSGATKLTRTGMTMGTVAYMSPEQARGEEVDQRSDIWSLGAVLYEMLSGQMPFPGDYDQAVVYRILHEEPESIFRLRPEVPQVMGTVLERALRKDPRERYSSVRESLSDLESMGKGRGSWRFEVRRFFLSGRRRAIAALLIVAVVATGAWLLLQKPGAVNGRDLALAVMDFESLGGSLDTLSAAGLSALLQVGLIEESPIRVISPEYLQDLRRRLFSGSQGAIRSDQALEVARKAGASLMLLGQIGRSQGASFVVWRLLETGRGQALGGRRIESADLVALADGIIAEAIPLIAAESRVEAPLAAGSVEQLTSALPEALRHFTAAEGMLKKSKNEEAQRQLEMAVQIDSTFALAWLRLADVCIWYTPQYGLAKKYADKAWDQRSRLGIKDRMKLEAIRLQNDRRMTEAFDVYEEMVERWPDDRTVLRHYATALYWHWLFPDAEAVAEKGLARFPDDDDLITLRMQALNEQGRATEALAAAREYQRRHPGEAVGWAIVGSAYLNGGAIDSAETAYRRARRLDPDDYRLQYDLARCEFLRGNPMEAAAIFERLLARSDLTQYQRDEVRFGSPPVMVYPGVIHCYAEVGRMNRALQLFDEMNPHIGSQGNWDYTRGNLFLDWGHPDLALAVAAERLRQQQPGQDRTLWLDLRTDALTDLDSLQAARECFAQRTKEEYRPSFFRYGRHVQEARIALNEGKPECALAHLDSFKLALARREYDTRASALRALKRLPEAAATLEELLRLNGSRFIARYQLGQIYEKMGRKTDAARQYEIFLKAWENADPDLPQVEDARKRLAALQNATRK